jgi:hypothetical protein
MTHFHRTVDTALVRNTTLCAVEMAAIGVVLLAVAIEAQQASLTPGTQTNGPPLPALVQLRAQMKQIREAQAQELAREIGPPPTDCQVDVSHIEGDELAEGLAEFVADVFRRAYWNVELSPSEQLTCAAPHILIQSSPSVATVATKLQATLGQRVQTAIVPVWVGDPHGCSLHVTVDPQ